ncbi:uncharacterized protein LOC116196199 isoform X2 [Punica granatum]|uniref:Uncharacterized protein LOC116196199 isoform X2 n=1 Tax=Punica granatum TaxID=22663 RepID=A0A218XFL7_PUNGR|nr:uncharacterized protein LOC116196199 isoform X2 [Punica granatum]OWM83132.1 hypothetical protein CDL15_Pgr011814 [Punica granatum]
MEDAQPQSPRRGFLPRRRSPLKSQTYRTLSRILSLFDDQNQPPRVVKFVPYQLPPGSLTLDDFVLNDATENTEHGTCDEGKMGDADVEKKDNFYEEKGGAVEESFGLSERGPNDTQMALSRIADLMSMNEEEPGDLSKQKENNAERTTDVVSLEDNASNREQMIVDEFKSIVDRDFGPVQDDSSIENNAVCLDKTPCGDGTVELERQHEEQSGYKQNVVNEFKEVALMLQDGEHLGQKGSEDLCSSPSNNALAPQPKESEVIESSFPRDNMLGADIAVQHNDSVASGDTLLAPIPMVVDDQMEEGELSDSFETEVPAPAHSENSQVPDEKLGNRQVSEAIVQGVDASAYSLGIKSNTNDHREGCVKETDGGNVGTKDDLDSCENARCLEAQGVDRRDNFIEDGKNEPQQPAAKEGAGMPATRSNDLVFYGDILEEKEIADEGFTPEKDIDVPKKRKRGPCSQERKEKKKKKERKKRAMKNKELGVKRLKLQPVQMPKKIPLCRHYIHGRCQEGEKCKFSHDTVPITKSTPCCYFARRSCMKGDNCPFDHQLSNYPCTKFASEGFCSRGDSCLFSHKVLPKDSTSAKMNASGPESRPPSKTNDASTIKRPDINSPSGRAAGAVLENLGISFKSMDQIIASSLGKAQVQKSNIGSHPVKDLTVTPAIKSGQSNSSLKGRDEGRLKNQAKESSSTGMVEETNESMKTSPSVASRGINFLSFARSSSNNANTGLPKSGNTITDKQVKADNQTLQNGLEKVFGSHKTPARAQVMGSEELNNIVSVKIPQNDAGTRKDATSPRTGDRSTQGEQMNKLQNSSVKACNMPTFPVITRQRAESSTPSPYKSMSNSTQKVLSSTLAFAARCEKEMMMKSRSSGDHATCSSTSKETANGANCNDTARAQKILDFLSSIGKKK